MAARGLFVVAFPSPAATYVSMRSCRAGTAFPCAEKGGKDAKTTGFLFGKTGGDVIACAITYYKGPRPQGLETAPF